MIIVGANKILDFYEMKLKEFKDLISAGAKVHYITDSKNTKGLNARFNGIYIIVEEFEESLKSICNSN